MNIKLIIYIGLTVLTSVMPCKADFVFSSNISRGIDAAVRMEMGLAEQLLAAEKSSSPKNTLVVLLENYIDFYSLILYDNPAAFAKREAKSDARFSRLEADKTVSPWKGFAYAEMQLHWTLMHAAQKNYVSAIRAMNKAKNAAADNEKNYPSFLLNQKTSGLLDAVFGSVPDNYKWMTDLAGFKGDQETGLKQYQALLSQISSGAYVCFSTEVRLILAYMYMYIREDKNTAWKMVNNSANTPETNLLSCFFIGNLSRQLGNNDLGIQTLLKRPLGKSYLQLPYFDYQLGSLLVYKGDARAVTYLNRYLQQQEIEDFKKDAALRMSWYYAMANEQEKFSQYQRMVLSVGREHNDKDKQALKEVKAKSAYNTPLLEARIFYDGGYFQRAKAVLDRLDAEKLNAADRIEYYYRLGRVLHDSGESFQALVPYTECVKLGSNDGNYLPANACLQLGSIYEGRKDAVRARFYYQKCLTYDKHPYTSSMHIRAKAGLKRLKGA